MVIEKYLFKKCFLGNYFSGDKASFFKRLANQHKNVEMRYLCCLQFIVDIPERGAEQVTINGTAIYANSFTDLNEMWRTEKRMTRLM